MPSKLKITTLRLPPVIENRLAAYVAKVGGTKNRVAIIAITKFLDENEKEESA